MIVFLAKSETNDKFWFDLIIENWSGYRKKSWVIPLVANITSKFYSTNSKNSELLKIKLSSRNIFPWQDVYKKWADSISKKRTKEQIQDL